MTTHSISTSSNWHICLSQLILPIQGITYEQQRGVPMGSPIAGDLCKIVMRKLEAEFLPKYLSNILIYKRYIDDILILWKDNKNIKALVEDINNNLYGLTIEIDQAHPTEAHFLDINMMIESATIHTAVYRKQTSDSLYIPAGSCDPPQYKVAAFKALIRRAHMHSWSEMKCVENIAEQYGYHGLIYKLNAKMQQEASRHQLSDDTPSSNIPITYNPVLKSLYKKIAKKKNICITFRRCATIFDLLRNGKDTPDRNKLPGIYTILVIDHRCDRNMIYIGSTKRPLITRICVGSFMVSATTQPNILVGL
ncbi:uncharacterized protein LOC111632760 [Centruroides sculpturatus]|uniref:uncharacterized protein LOC111632760 n=1 Tax=Centruroides sculpturatus TaxID=218467 RepID=UPI000C6CB2E8|nr:uncharacterized protein LOC111632760 [Centruroides sculpturatus]